MSLSGLLVHAHDRIQSQFTQQQALMPSGASSIILFFSLCDGQSRAVVRHYRADTLEAAWQQAVQNTQRLASRNKNAFKWLRVDWVREIQPTTWQDLNALLKQTKRNYFRLGLALDAKLDVAFLEQELNANAMLYPGSNKVEAGLNLNNFTVYARRRFGKEVVLDFSPENPVYLFAHDGLFLSDDPQLAALPEGNGPIALPGPGTTQVHWRDSASLNASRRQIKSLNPDQVYTLIDSSANFLASQVQQTGQFIYGHFPCFGREIPTYNALRHASSVYSMLEGWELTRNDALLAAVRRSLIYLTETLIRHYPQPDGTTLAYNVDINGEIKLGANAVSLLALVKYDELTGDTRYRPLMEQLALGIGRMQNAENGSFVHVLHSTDLSLKETFRIVYYDGEAAFGLMRLYGLTRDARWLSIVERAFDYFIRADHWKHHDHWLSYCANELTLYKPQEKYFRFGVQNVAGYLDFILKRETTYPTLLELSMAFEAMLGRIETNHPEMRHVLEGLDIDKFHRALHHRAHYLLNGFFWPEFAMYFAKPESILGSFFIRHHTFRVRIDDIEHYLSGYVAYWKMLKKTASISPPPTPEPGGDQVTNTLPAANSVAVSAPAPSRPVVAWGGDVNLGRRQHYRTAELGPANVLPIPALKDADLSIVNLECVVATQGEQGINKGEGGPYYYRARPEMLQILLESHIDVVTTANNHSGDYGPDALLEQGAWLDAIGIGHAGTGAHREAALTPVLRRAGELNIAIFSIDATQHRYAATDRRPGSAYLPLHDAAAWHAEFAPRITAIRQRAHIVLVAVHWGENLATMPDAAEIAVGHSLIDAGADAVLGASAHVLQGIEIYRDRPIIHDAGDLLFDSVRSTLGDSGIFRLELSHHGVERIVFVPIGIGFGFSEQLSGQAAQTAVRNYAIQCAATASQLIPTADGCGYIELTPPARPFLRKIPAPQATCSPEILSAPIYPELETHQNWTIDTIPADARMEPCKLGPLTLLGCRVSPTTIDRRRMLWVESFWCCDDAVQEDIRLDFRAVPQSPTRMKPWGISMDHDPCDWLMPTSRWKPGTIYRDYYGLRPPYLKDWENVDLQVSVKIVSAIYPTQPVWLPWTVQLAVPGKNQTASSSLNAQDEKPARYSFSSSELEKLTHGHWEYPPEKEIYLDYFVTGAGFVKEPRTCMVCMFYETWLKGTGNSGHYKNIFSDSHISFLNQYNKANLKENVNCLVVQRPIPELSHIPQLVVKDSYQILKTLATAARNKMADNGTIFAVTGAVGKSTTCDLLTRAIRPFSNCIAMTNGHNSRTGVVIWTASLGMFDPAFNQENNLPNTCILEVAGSALWMKSGWAMQAVRPNIAIITHIELTQYGASSKSIEDVAYFKSRICETIYPDGKAVLYREMPLYDKVLEYVKNYGATPCSYGESPDADARLLSYHFNLPTIDQQQTDLTMSVKANILGEEVSYDVGAIGKPVALNSLAALTAAKLAGFDIQASAKALEDFKARDNTLAISTHNNVLVVDCSHNLEIPSILAAFDVLKQSEFSKNGRRIVIMSRIVNMGNIATDFHLKLEEPFNSYGFDKFFIHNPNHEWDKLLPKLPEGLVGGVSTDAKGTVSQFMEYVQEGDSVLLLGASRGCDFGEVLPNILKKLKENFQKIQYKKSAPTATLVSIRGKVQGVGYRNWARRNAKLRALSGWVCNQNDGSVQMLLAGDSDAISDMLAECRKGPDESNVIEVKTESWSGPLTDGFEIINKNPSNPAMDKNMKQSDITATSSDLIFHEIKIPACLKGQQNGKVDARLLEEIRGGFLLAPAAKKWNEMRHSAFLDGVVLMPVNADSTYRNLTQQEKIFLACHDPCEPSNAAIQWNDRHWSLKKNLALAAIPGTSNHGWGLSIDVRLTFYGREKDWLLDHAPIFGFCWEYESEPWHITYFPGDKVTRFWSAHGIEQATPGTWLTKPKSHFLAKRIVALTPDYQPGDVVVLANGTSGLGIQPDDLVKLPAPPAAIITSLEHDNIPEPLTSKATPIYQVKSSKTALYHLAHFSRSQFKGKLIGITGTSGKTSTTSMLFKALLDLEKDTQISRGGNVSAAIAKSLRGMPWDADFYVVEIEQSTIDISSLVARPDVAIITSIGPGHLEKHKNTIGVAKRKAMIFDGMADGSIAIICHDTEHSDILINKAKDQRLRIYTYGQHTDATIRLLNWDEAEQQALVATPVGSLHFHMPVEGLHMVQNAMACIATALALELDAEKLVKSFSTFKPVKGRGVVHVLQRDNGGSFTVIDESYNANPLSMKAAIDASNARFRNGEYQRHVLILGDMLELGADEVAYHAALADALKKQPADVLVLCGPLMAHLAAKLRESGSSCVIEAFQSVEQVIEWTEAHLHDGDLVLVKSSNGTGLHRLVEELVRKGK
ncbi:UDP-N-acetylmuramyl pentapeptide synthase [Lampropedia hyalina DSM 16112]|jgi:UDP-N-acetylmuramyl pentapeptide synthase/poly-gamma-glutamate capsule biosynthesis protein CapA/YwtB (metallophosphatase superfamily)/acylphosphatase/LAS superfamily LD-carboxypeptidase LdcB|uniref:acylphosphatase n=1 Tax=Lampropedia hyalina DSM 16112 TaxID=1122156 RepID=A0A1M5CBM9_9BURK|nr:CapA family protein [Lampropedia hyalina]SHF52119.1 UDP-N-acetylmuramyl pentapeptide synthase [Lampropedia hyalina DSM 16112]